MKDQALLEEIAIETWSGNAISKLIDKSPVERELLNPSLDYAKRLQAVESLVVLSDPHFVPTLLVVLEKYGNEFICQSLLNSSNKELIDAATSWAHSHNYKINTINHYYNRH